jgi:hypothetical protein
MVDRFRQIQGAQTFHRTAPLPGNGLHTSPSKIGSARLLIPQRRVIPPSASVERAVWLFRTLKLELPAD